MIGVYGNTRILLWNLCPINLRVLYHQLPREPKEEGKSHLTSEYKNLDY